MGLRRESIAKSDFGAILFFSFIAFNNIIIYLKSGLVVRVSALRGHRFLSFTALCCPIPRHEVNVHLLGK
jgi:hypothetical protein